MDPRLYSPIAIARNVLGDRYRQGKRGEIYIDGRQSDIREAIMIANKILAKQKQPLIHYPSVNPKNDRSVA